MCGLKCEILKWFLLRNLWPVITLSNRVSSSCACFILLPTFMIHKTDATVIKNDFSYPAVSFDLQGFEFAWCVYVYVCFAFLIIASLIASFTLLIQIDRVDFTDWISFLPSNLIEKITSNLKTLSVNT